MNSSFIFVHKTLSFNMADTHAAHLCQQRDWMLHDWLEAELRAARLASIEKEQVPLPRKSSLIVEESSGQISKGHETCQQSFQICIPHWAKSFSVLTTVGGMQSQIQGSEFMRHSLQPHSGSTFARSTRHRHTARRFDRTSCNRRYCILRNGRSFTPARSLSCRQVLYRDPQTGSHSNRRAHHGRDCPSTRIA